MLHEIKLQKEFADSVMSGEKNFEVRYNDRGYQKGDYIKFKVMNGSMQIFHPLNNLYYKITYVLSGWGIKEDYVVFGIERVEYEEKVR